MYFSIILKVICIAIGGGFGAAVRYSIGEFCHLKTSLPDWGAILLANLLGSFVIGLAYSALTAEMLRTIMLDANQPKILEIELLDLRLLTAFTLTGLCGGLTTFSSFSIDTFILYRQGKIAQAIANVVLSIVLGTLAALTGLYLGGVYGS